MRFWVADTGAGIEADRLPRVVHFHEAVGLLDENVFGEIGVIQSAPRSATATVTDDAILLARKFKPRLAILDMRMQGKSGMDVARYLAANTSTGFMFLSAFGDADILMNNAGVMLRGPLERMPTSDWQWIMDINFLGAASSSASTTSPAMPRTSCARR